MNILALDPGTTQSAWLVYDCDAQKPTAWDIAPNADVLQLISEFNIPLVYEMIAAQGMAVGFETFETVWWIGRFAERAHWCDLPSHRVYRHEEKMHLCGSMKAKDPNIRQALIDRYGGKEAAIGKKATPGPLYKLSSHCWAALAVARTWADTKYSTVATVLG